MNNISQNEQVINKDSVSLNSYEEMAEYYFKYVDTKPFNVYYERPAAISLLPQVRGKKVLDAGCVAGWYTKWLLENGQLVISTHHPFMDFTVFNKDNYFLTELLDDEWSH